MADDTVETASHRAAELIRRLEPGPLAAVRRMDAERRSATYWRLAAASPALERAPEAWVEILRAFALLTPKGRPEDRVKAAEWVRLGAALCDGGDPAWGRGGPVLRPVLSETRLARLLAARGTQRSVALTRAIRGLAPGWPGDRQIHPGDMAWAYLSPRSDVIAKHYYDRLDRAVRIHQEETAT